MNAVPRLPSPKPYAPRSHSSVTVGHPDAPAPRFQTDGMEVEEVHQITSPAGVAWMIGRSVSPVDVGDIFRAFPDTLASSTVPDTLICLSDATIDGLIDTINRHY